MSACDFDIFVLNAVDEVLSAVDENLPLSVYFNLERLNIKKREIPSKIDVFTKTMEKLMGSGAGVLEICIAKKLYDKVGLVFEANQFNMPELGEYVKRARQRVYTEFVNKMQNGLAVFHLENADDLGSFKLVSINAKASGLMGVDSDRAVGGNISQICPRLFPDYVERIFADVLDSKRTKVVARFYRKDEDGHERLFSVTAFPLSSNCLGLAFKCVIEPEQHLQKPRATEDTLAVAASSKQRIVSKTVEAHSTRSEPKLSGSITVSANIDGESWSKFHEAVIKPLTNLKAKLEIHVEVSGTSDDEIFLNAVDSVIRRSLIQNNIAASVEVKKKPKKQ